MYPGYEQYWTGIQSEPDKPPGSLVSAPTPAELGMGPLHRADPALCAFEHADFGSLAEDELRPADSRKSPP